MKNPKRSYFVYILTNKYNRVLYTGVTNDLQRRMFEHKSKMTAGFTKKYNVDKLVYFEEFKYVEDAIGMEKKIKGWLRNKKVALIEQHNPGWQELSI